MEINKINELALLNKLPVGIKGKKLHIFIKQNEFNIKFFEFLIDFLKNIIQKLKNKNIIINNKPIIPVSDSA